MVPIFDKDKVEEKHLVVNRVAVLGNELIGDISLHKATALVSQAETALAAGDAVEAKAYQDEAKKWMDGGVYKIALHSGFSGAVASLAGGNAVTGIATGGGNEALNGALEGLEDPALRKTISAILGQAIAGHMGSGLAVSETEHNYLTHSDQGNFFNDYERFKNGHIDHDTFVKKLAYYEQLMWHEKNHPLTYQTRNYTSKFLIDNLRFSDEYDV